jgi:hypothetical protein
MIKEVPLRYGRLFKFNHSRNIRYDYYPTWLLCWIKRTKYLLKHYILSSSPLAIKGNGPTMDTVFKGILNADQKQCKCIILKILYNVSWKQNVDSVLSNVVCNSILFIIIYKVIYVSNR